jgi:hypothetical protein
MLLQQISKGFLGKLVDISAALERETGKGVPSGATKGDTSPHFIILLCHKHLARSKHKRRCYGQKDREIAMACKRELISPKGDKLHPS